MISISKNFPLAPLALASYFSTHILHSKFAIFHTDLLFETYTRMDMIIIGRELRGATMHPPHNKTPLDFFEALGCPEHVINW